MAEFTIREYSWFDEFAAEWDESEIETELLWELLSLIPDDEVLVELPEWIAEEKTGFVDGATPTVFVGHLVEETEKAVKLDASADAKSLVKLAHRIHHLEDRDHASDNEQWLENRLEELWKRFRARDDADGLSDEWLPKSQLEHVCRRYRRP